MCSRSGSICVPHHDDVFERDDQQRQEPKAIISALLQGTSLRPSSTHALLSHETRPRCGYLTQVRVMSIQERSRDVTSM